MDYLDRYRVTTEKLAQQFISTNRSEFQVENLGRFLQNRAKALAEAANRFFESLGG
jgi:hypothetical protein